MNFSTMDYFVALAEEKSFTKAAERLAVTQQTLSAHIAGVERELGVRLVNRKVPLTLTYAGEVFLGYARRFQALRRTMGQEFLDIAKDERGLLGVGIASTRGHMLMPATLARFQREHPGISVLLHESENQELISLVKEGRVDLAVATVPDDEPGLVVRRLCREKIVLILTEDLLRESCDDVDEARREAARGNLAPLARCPFMMLGKADEPGAIARRILERSGVKPWNRVFSKNSETLMDLAARGVGACFVPRALALGAMGRHPEAGLTAVGLGDDAAITISAAWRDSDHVWSVILAFYELLADELALGESAMLRLDADNVARGVRA